MGTLSKAQEYDESSKKWHELTDTVSHCLSKEMVPLYIAVKQHSHGLVSGSEPRVWASVYKVRFCLYEKTWEKVATDVGTAEYWDRKTPGWSEFMSRWACSEPDNVPLFHRKWSLQ